MGETKHTTVSIPKELAYEIDKLLYRSPNRPYKSRSAFTIAAIKRLLANIKKAQE